MAQTVFRCPASMPTELLAAWHDHTLNADQEANVSAHVATCPACQAYVSEYAQDDTALRRAEAPALQERIWRGVRADVAQLPPRRAGLPRNAILGGLGAALAVTLLFAAVFVFVLDNKGSTRSLSIAPTATASATATNTAIPTPTITPLQVSPSQGWVTATALTYGKDIAFSQSDPLTGYACGNTGNDSKKALLLGITHDGGRTWSSPVTTLVTGNNCLLFINPTNSADIVLQGGVCWGGCGDDPFILSYRSSDAGQTWTKLVLPPENGQSAYNLVGHPVWAGNTMYVTASSEGGVANPTRHPHEIATSINGAPLAWVDLTQAYAGIVDPSIYVSSIFALQSTFYVYLGYPPTTYLAKTNDNGVTWSQFTPKGTLPEFIIVGMDGKTLFGEYPPSLLHSTDSGATWATLAKLPGITLGVIATPDGIVYANITPTTQGSHPGFYKLVASQWTQVASLDGTQNPVTISLNSARQPLAVWATVITSSQGNLQPGIAYHAA